MKSSACVQFLPTCFLFFSDFFLFLFFFFFSLLQVALHACGVATDMVMEHCVQAGAAFVISPCCYGFIQNAVNFTFPKRFVSGCSGSPLEAVYFILFIFFFVDLALLLGSCWLEWWLVGGWLEAGQGEGACFSQSLSLCLMRMHKHSLDVLSRLLFSHFRQPSYQR